MKTFTTLLAIIFFSLSLSACSSDEGQESAELIRQSFQNFIIDIPADWRKIPADSFANTIPEGTVAIFLKRDDTQDFIQNVNVVKESLNTNATSLEYGKANRLLGSKAIVDYREISAEESTINGVPTLIHLFRARNTTTDPLRHYSQSYFARDRIGYTVTCIAQEDNPAQQQSCRQIIGSFQFTN